MCSFESNKNKKIPSQANLRKDLRRHKLRRESTRKESSAQTLSLFKQLIEE